MQQIQSSNNLLYSNHPSSHSLADQMEPVSFTSSFYKPAVFEDSRYATDIMYTHPTDSKSSRQRSGTRSSGRRSSRPRQLSDEESRRSNSHSDRGTAAGHAASISSTVKNRQMPLINENSLESLESLNPSEDPRQQALDLLVNIQEVYEANHTHTNQDLRSFDHSQKLCKPILPSSRSAQKSSIDITNQATTRNSVGVNYYMSSARGQPRANNDAYEGGGTAGSEARLASRQSESRLQSKASSRYDDYVPVLKQQVKQVAHTRKASIPVAKPRKPIKHERKPSRGGAAARQDSKTYHNHQTTSHTSRLSKASAKMSRATESISETLTVQDKTPIHHEMTKRNQEQEGRKTLAARKAQNESALEYGNFGQGKGKQEMLTPPVPIQRQQMTLGEELQNDLLYIDGGEIEQQTFRRSMVTSNHDDFGGNQQQIARGPGMPGQFQQQHVQLLPQILSPEDTWPAQEPAQEQQYYGNVNDASNDAHGSEWGSMQGAHARLGRFSPALVGADRSLQYQNQLHNEPAVAESGQDSIAYSIGSPLRFRSNASNGSYAEQESYESYMEKLQARKALQTVQTQANNDQQIQMRFQPEEEVCFQTKEHRHLVSPEELAARDTRSGHTEYQQQLLIQNVDYGGQQSSQKHVNQSPHRYQDQDFMLSQYGKTSNTNQTLTDPLYFLSQNFHKENYSDSRAPRIMHTGQSDPAGSSALEHVSVSLVAEGDGQAQYQHQQAFVNSQNGPYAQVSPNCALNMTYQDYHQDADSPARSLTNFVSEPTLIAHDSKYSIERRRESHGSQKDSTKRTRTQSRQRKHRGSIINIQTKSPKVRKKDVHFSSKVSIHKRKARSASVPLKKTRSRSKSQRKGLKVVKGKLVHVQHRTEVQTARKMEQPTYTYPIRLRSASLKKPQEITPLQRKDFKFKVFTSIREILEYLRVSSVAFLFDDHGVKNTSEFYGLDELALKKMLVSAAARKAILAYSKFYNKQLQKKIIKAGRVEHRVPELNRPYTVGMPGFRSISPPPRPANFNFKPILQPKMRFAAGDGEYIKELPTQLHHEASSIQQFQQREASNANSTGTLDPPNILNINTGQEFEQTTQKTGQSKKSRKSKSRTKSTKRQREPSINSSMSSIQGNDGMNGDHSAQHNSIKNRRYPSIEGQVKEDGAALQLPATTRTQASLVDNQNSKSITVSTNKLAPRIKQLVAELNLLLNHQSNEKQNLATRNTTTPLTSTQQLEANYQKKIDDLKNNGFFMGTFDDQQLQGSFQSRDMNIQRDYSLPTTFQNTGNSHLNNLLRRHNNDDLPTNVASAVASPEYMSMNYHDSIDEVGSMPDQANFTLNQINEINENQINRSPPRAKGMKENFQQKRNVNKELMKVRSPQREVKFEERSQGYASTSRTKPSEMVSGNQNSTRIQRQESRRRISVGQKKEHEGQGCAPDAFENVHVVVGKRISMSPENRTRSSRTRSTRQQSREYLHSQQSMGYGVHANPKLQLNHGHSDAQLHKAYAELSSDHMRQNSYADAPSLGATEGVLYQGHHDLAAAFSGSQARLPPRPQHPPPYQRTSSFNCMSTLDSQQSTKPKPHRFAPRRLGERDQAATYGQQIKRNNAVFQNANKQIQEFHQRAAEIKERLDRCAILSKDWRR